MLCEETDNQMIGLLMKENRQADNVYGTFWADKKYFWLWFFSIILSCYKILMWDPFQRVDYRVYPGGFTLLIYNFMHKQYCLYDVFIVILMYGS